MSRADTIYRKQLDLNEVERDMRSINPALALYRNLAEKREVLMKELKVLRESVI
jgi:hypothetical protein